MIYILGGVGKTGCSTLAMMLAENNQIPRVYGGAFMRREAMLAGFARPGYEIPTDQAEWNLDKANVAGFRAMCEKTERDIDAEIEVYLLKEMAQAERTGDDLVVESKTMSRLLHSDAVDGLLVQAQQDLAPDVPRVQVNELLQGSKAVWIHADPEVRARRALSKPTGGSSGSIEGCVPKPISPEDLMREMTELATRAAVDGHDYARRYGMFDYPVNGEMPGEAYGHGIDNSCHTSCDQTYGEVRQYFGTPA